MTTIIDTHGRTVTVAVDQAGMDVYSLAGITASFPHGYDQASALDTIEGMAPADYVAPTPVKTTMPFLDFMALFTPLEQAAIVNSTDTQVRLFTLQASGVQTIDLKDKRVIDGVNYCVSIGILTSSNAAQILQGKPSA